MVLFRISEEIEPPGLGFNFEISSIASFNCKSEIFNFSISFLYFLLENNSNSFSIIFDALNTVEGAIVKVKDPMEYLNRLEFHKNSKSFEDYFF